MQRYALLGSQEYPVSCNEIIGDLSLEPECVAQLKSLAKLKLYFILRPLFDEDGNITSFGLVSADPSISMMCGTVSLPTINQEPNTTNQEPA